MLLVKTVHKIWLLILYLSLPYKTTIVNPWDSASYHPQISSSHPRVYASCQDSKFLPTVPGFLLPAKTSNFFLLSQGFGFHLECKFLSCVPGSLLLARTFCKFLSPVRGFVLSANTANLFLLSLGLCFLPRLSAGFLLPYNCCQIYASCQDTANICFLFTS